MRDSISAFIEHCAALRYSQETLSGYRRTLDLFRRFATDKKVVLVRDVRLQLVREFHDAQIAKGLKTSSIETYLFTLRNYLKWCYERRFILSDLSGRMEIPRKENTLPPTPLTEDEVLTLLHALPTKGIGNLRNLALIEILYACGLRKQEVINLNIGDVDFATGIVHVRGKGDKERLVPVHERALKAISNYLVERGDKPNRNSPLLLSHSHRNKVPIRMTGIGISKIFQRLSRVFPKHLHPHLFRHTFALHLLQHGVDLRYVQLLLGHENPDTTSRYLGYCKAEIKAQYDQGIDWILAAE